MPMRIQLLAMVVVASLAMAASAAAREVWLDYTDGPEIYACDAYGREGDVYTMRFTPEARATLLRVWFRAEDAGTLEIHVWPDVDGLPDTARDLIEPFEVETEDGSKPYSIDVSAADLTIDARLEFHVGLVRKTDDGARLCMDSTKNALARAWRRIAGTWQNNERDWMLRVQADYTDEPTRWYFEDITAASGFVPGSRVAAGDYDNDGDVDLLVSGVVLFENDGSGIFTDATAAAGLGGVGGNGGLFADIDNDGDLDVFTMVNSLAEYDRIFVNNGDGTFIDVTDTAIAEADRDLLPTEGAAFADVNGDGFLDLYLANYEMPQDVSGELAVGTRDKLFLNGGDGTFTEVGEAWGIDPLLASDDHRCGRGVNAADFDEDGDADIYVSDYRLDPNFLWVNNGDASVTERAEELGIQGNRALGSWGHTIGSAWGDFNNDAHLDLFTANLAHPRYADFSDVSHLYINNGPPAWDFTDATNDWGIVYIETHSEPALGDWNNDGWLDLLLTNVYPDFFAQLYRNNGNGTFTELYYYSGLAIEDGWGAVLADVDADGWLDVVSNRGLFRNTLGEWDEFADHHWLKVRARCTDGDPFCVGARIEVQLAADSGTQAREIAAGKGTTNQDDFTQHFGLNLCETAWRVTVRFPGGDETVRYQVPADSLIEITQGDPSDPEPKIPPMRNECALVDYPEPEWPDADDDVDDDAQDDDAAATDDDMADGDSGDAGDDDSDDGGCGC